MITNSFGCEFGYELIAVIPFAYYLYIHGKLEGTISMQLTEPLYYFSPDHKTTLGKRGDEGAQKLIMNKYPNVPIHIPKLDQRFFIPPPYKKQFKNDIYKWEKPTICICNKYNIEWGQPPINFFSIELLDKMFSMLKDKYQIVYFAIEQIDEIKDNADYMHLDDREVCKKHPEVIIFQDLLKKCEYNWNDLLLRIFANSERFVTLNGGLAILASYFGGKNLILCIEGSEIKSNSFGWYHLFGNSEIILKRNYEDLLECLKKF